GISAEGQTLIFDPFHQADQKVTRRHAGTGLGLAITHSLIKMMKGDITLDSQVNVGSTFTVMLPRKVESVQSQGD
ncbi:MAG: ATP-binding protein, partial [Cyanobacteria bacterium P01_A01_bin.116]